MTRQPRTTRQNRTTRETRRYPNGDEETDAPLVPVVTTPPRPDDEETLRGIRRELSALREQLERVEAQMETDR
jgi:hypothetical protein